MSQGEGWKSLGILVRFKWHNIVPLLNVLAHWMGSSCVVLMGKEYLLRWEFQSSVVFLKTDNELYSKFDLFMSIWNTTLCLSNFWAIISLMWVFRLSRLNVVLFSLVDWVLLVLGRKNEFLWFGFTLWFVVLVYCIVGLF